jgi:hypothetical protein
MPWPVEWLWVILRARRLMLRQPFGRMLFSGGKLRAAGYEFRFGMSRAIADFHRELAGTTAGSAEPSRRPARLHGPALSTGRHARTNGPRARFHDRWSRLANQGLWQRLQAHLGGHP